jgi:hypothetical protein
LRDAASSHRSRGADCLPVQKKRKAVEKAIKTTLQQMLAATVRFRILHHDSKSCCSLQAADYFNWAVYRRRDRGDDGSLNLVKRAVKSQFDIFRTVGLACSLILW